MEDIEIKFREIIKPLIIISIILIPTYTLLNYYIMIKYELFLIDMEISNILIPLLLATALNSILIKDKFDLLKFRINPDKKRFYYFIFSILIIAIPLSFAQTVLKHKEEKVVQSKNLNQIIEFEKFKIYKVEDIKFLKKDAQFSFNSELSIIDEKKPTHRKLYLYYYIVCPIITSTPKKLINNLNITSSSNKYWYGVKFYKELDNPTYSLEKNLAIKSFINESIKSFNNMDLTTIKYLTKIQRPRDKEGFLNAIKSNNLMMSEDYVTIFKEKNIKDITNSNFYSYSFILVLSIILLTLFALILFYTKSNKREYFPLSKEEIWNFKTQSLKLLIPEKGHFLGRVLIDINIFVFIVMLISGVNPITVSSEDLINFGANTTLIFSSGEYWRLFSSLFIHAGILHLILNLYFLFALSIIIESKFGQIKFLIIYIISGIGSNFFSVYLHENIISVGASGAIFGLAGAFLSLIATNVTLEKSKTSILLTFGALTLLFLIIGFIQPNVDNIAHISGLIIGAIIGYLLIDKENFVKEKENRNKNMT